MIGNLNMKELSIYMIKDMLCHHSVKQTDEYTLTKQEAIRSEMQILKVKLEGRATKREKQEYNGSIK
ncbi:hypothetical protein HX017_17665 [Myroides marinus]|uniref:hypothetical protein n=1 Tax=Myroides marinus TaxID=703342 RepID=UPI0025764B2D|nr:hypothetical protein [Myroides marinus]MDM1352424.1 hypothetical protein [Myroides marinus]MDM1353204.1 hypothetical protein [Myroides marinus]MDM1359629.1 hypothetical protein [Myroides marinus]MDM1366758.1 hypothetical protein [Myroides marinus]MDM1533941.1 hypothetical protein [Myroides marinus]